MQRPSRGRGFEDVKTELDSLKDFSLPADESDVTTALMKEKDLQRVVRAESDIVRAARIGSREGLVDLSGDDESSDDYDADSSSTVVSKMTPEPRVVDSFADETLKINRPEVPPSTQRFPRRK